jgi:hypothetical protein
MSRNLNEIVLSLCSILLYTFLLQIPDLLSSGILDEAGVDGRIRRPGVVLRAVGIARLPRYKGGKPQRADGRSSTVGRGSGRGLTARRQNGRRRPPGQVARLAAIPAPGRRLLVGLPGQVGILVMQGPEAVGGGGAVHGGAWLDPRQWAQIIRTI